MENTKTVSIKKQNKSAASSLMKKNHSVNYEKQAGGSGTGYCSSHDCC